MNRLPIRVAKVGGSLFDLPDLPDRLHGWLAKQTPAHHVLIAGGGALVEQVRQWHDLRPLKDESAHWLCVDLMSVTARMLHSSMPDIPLVKDDQSLCQRISDQGCSVFEPNQWLRASEPKLPGRTLQTNWDVTSDSIAARLAIALNAGELTLLKSTLPDSAECLQQLAEIGYVDRGLVAFKDELPTTKFVDLRDDSYRTMKLDLV